jgi:diguanylate cyclase (GGDEF)-like protein
MTGYKKDELIGRSPSILKSGCHDEAFYDAMQEGIRKDGGWKGRIWNRRKAGEVFLADLSIRAVKKDEQNVLHYIGVLIDLSPSLTDTYQQNHYDIITELPNRVLLSDRLDFMLAHAKHNSQILAILLIDINGFKHANTTLGYAAGDSILQTIAARLRKTVREVDAIFRFGNDEFAVVLEEIAQVEDAAKVAKKILANVFTEPMRPVAGKQELFISASIGISIFPHDASDKKTLLKNAETAMHKAKEQGENSCEHYAPEMNRRALEVLTIESRLHNALSRKEFQVYYQPLIELQTGKITSAEALIRWNHPEMGIVSPGEFLSFAEESGLAVPIGEWVLFTACEHAKKWHENGLPKIRVSVNLSARQFQQQNLSSRIREALESARLDAKYLELEITESLCMKNAEMTMRTLCELKETGVQLVLDDFGTGYSSLNYLERFPLDMIKIDLSLVHDIASVPDSKKIVSVVIDMAHSFKFKVLAEGVEGSKQLAFLRRRKCDRIQGYLFSPPLPLEQFEELMKKTKGKMA